MLNSKKVFYRSCRKYFIIFFINFLLIIMIFIVSMSYFDYFWMFLGNKSKEIIYLNEFFKMILKSRKLREVIMKFFCWRLLVWNGVD